MNALEKLKKLFDEIEVYYINLNSNEIVVLAPSIEFMDFMPLSPLDTSYSDPRSGSYDDETCIHICYNEEHNSLDWGIVLGEGSSVV